MSSHFMRLHCLRQVFTPFAEPTALTRNFLSQPRNTKGQHGKKGVLEHGFNQEDADTEDTNLKACAFGLCGVGVRRLPT